MSEFWNRDVEASGSEEDISESDGMYIDYWGFWVPFTETTWKLSCLVSFLDFQSWLSRNYLYLDALDAAKNAASSKTSAKLKLQDKIDMLQRAEENYYQNKSLDKQVAF